MYRICMYICIVVAVELAGYISLRHVIESKTACKFAEICMYRKFFYAVSKSCIIIAYTVS